MKVETLIRSFVYGGMELLDPNPTFTVTQVRDMYAAAYPEITTAVIEGPERKADKLVYTFKRAVGTKGNVHLYLDHGSDGMPYVKVSPSGTPEPVVDRVLKKAVAISKTVLDKVAYFVDNYLFKY